MGVSPVLLQATTTESGGWETPQAFFDRLDAEFDFDLDVAAEQGNTKCRRFYDEAHDALQQPWAPFTCWLNPPYGRGIGAWLQKACYEGWRGATVVVLVPVRTDTAWWQDWAMKADEIRLIRGRLAFHGAPTVAPFPSAVLIYRVRQGQQSLTGPRIYGWSWEADSPEEVEVAA
jgi:phage N-6-adenine-methyltransferase